MRLSPDELKRAASGCFVSDVDPPTFSSTRNHPLRQMIDRDAKSRENQLLLSPKTEAILVVHNNNLVTINIPQAGFDWDADPELNHPLIIGAIGAECISTLPGCISLWDALSDCYILAPTNHDANGFFPSGETLLETCFEEGASANAIPRPELEGDLKVYRLPRSLPKVVGIPIVEGSIFSNEVSQSLADYHPIAGAWIEMHKLVSKNSDLMVQKQKIERLGEKYLPIPVSKIPGARPFEVRVDFLVHGNYDPASLRYKLQQRIKQRISENTAKFFKENPDCSPEVPSTQPNLSQKSVAQKENIQQENTEEELVDKKYARAIATWRLLLASKGPNHMSLPDLSPRFLQCYRQSGATENARVFKGFILDWMKDRSEENRDYFFRSITSLSWSHATITLLLAGIFHSKPLDEVKNQLEHTISLLNFLPEPAPEENADYKKYVVQSQLEEAEYMVEESNEKKAKKNTKTFCKGLQDEPHHVLTSLANFDAVLAFAVPFDDLPEAEQPLLVRYLRQLANVIGGMDFRSYHAKFGKDLPWLTHNILCFGQNILSEAVSIAMSSKNTNLVREEQPIPISLYDKMTLLYQEVTRDIVRACKLSQSGCFQQPARSYVPPASSQPNLKRKSEGGGEEEGKQRHKNNGRGSTASKKGWFVATGRFRWPDELSVRPCNKFGQQGSVCRNTNCSFAHKVFPDNFSENDRNIIIKFEKENDNFSFASHVIVKDDEPKLAPKPKDTSVGEGKSSPKKDNKKVKLAPAVTPVGQQ